MAAKKKTSPNKARSSRSPKSPSDAKHPEGERLQKILAAAGLGSRRECEELITAGRVEVNRQVVDELGARANATHDEIRVDGVPLRRPKRVYYALNKPPGIVSTSRDPQGRARVIDLIDSHERLFTVGRLDRSSEGLILVTNDGDLANRLTHPRYRVPKIYHVEVAGHPPQEQIQQLREGVRLAEGLVRVESIQIRRAFSKSTELEIVLMEGINREVRRILAKVGHKVLRLTRVAIGRLRLGELPTGAYRELTRHEVESLLTPEGRRERVKKPDAGPKRVRAAGRPGKKSVRPAKKSVRGGKTGGKKPALKPSRRVGSVLSYDEPEGEPKQTDRKVAKKSAKKPFRKPTTSGRPTKSTRPNQGKRRP